MMENNKQLIADAYGKAMDAEYDAILAEEEETEPHQFSERFEEKMNDLINGDASEKKGASRRRLRPIWLIAAAVLLLAATACAVPSIRKSIAGFFVRMFGDHVEYYAPDAYKKGIEEEYGLAPVPDGFSVQSHYKIDIQVNTVYADIDGNTILLSQAANQTPDNSVDNEHGEFVEHEIGERTVLIRITEENAHSSWVENGYFFTLDYSSPIDLDTFIRWISTVSIIE